MEIRIDLKLPGSYLSSRSMYWVLSEIVNTIYKGMYEGILYTYPEVSKRDLKKEISKQNVLFFTNMKKGSWELALAGALGGVILKVLYDVGIDILKGNPKYQEIKDKINGSISRNTAQEIKDRLEQRTQLGPFLIEKKTIEIETKPDKTQLLKIETTLIRRPDSTFDSSPDNNVEIEKALREIEDLMHKPLPKNAGKESETGADHEGT